MRNRASTVGYMKKTFAWVLCGLAAFLVSTGLAAAQSPATMPSNSLAASQGQKAANPSPTAAHAPSEIAIAPSGTPDDYSSRRRQGSPLGANAAMGRRSAEGANLPHLCFQPGIGWTSVPAAVAPAGTNKPEADHSPHNRRGAYSAGNAGVQADCPQSPLPQTAPQENDGDGNSDHSYLEIKNSLLTSDPGQSSYNGIQPLLANNPLSATKDSAVARPALDLPGGLKSKGSYASSDPGAALEELKALRRRAYVSPVKLRRMSRNMQDLESRLEFRQMNTEVQKRKAKRTAQDQNTADQSGKAAEHKPLNSHDLMAKKAECERKGDASKSKVCAFLKH